MRDVSRGERDEENEKISTWHKKATDENRVEKFSYACIVMCCIRAKVLSFCGMGTRKAIDRVIFLKRKIYCNFFIFSFSPSQVLKGVYRRI